MQGSVLVFDAIMAAHRRCCLSRYSRNTLLLLRLVRGRKANKPSNDRQSLDLQFRRLLRHGGSLLPLAR